MAVEFEKSNWGKNMKRQYIVLVFIFGLIILLGSKVHSDELGIVIKKYIVENGNHIQREYKRIENSSPHISTAFSLLLTKEVINFDIMTTLPPELSHRPDCRLLPTACPGRKLPEEIQNMMDSLKQECYARFSSGLGENENCKLPLKISNNVLKFTNCSLVREEYNLAVKCLADLNFETFDDCLKKLHIAKEKLENCI